MLKRFLCFSKNKQPKTIVENVVVNYSMSDPLPDSDVELYVIEHAIARRMSVVNNQIQKVSENCAYCAHRQNLQELMKYAKEKKKLQDDLRQLSIKFMEVTERRNALLPPKQV